MKGRGKPLASNDFVLRRPMLESEIRKNYKTF